MPCITAKDTPAMAAVLIRDFPILLDASNAASLFVFVSFVPNLSHHFVKLLTPSNALLPQPISCFLVYSAFSSLKAINLSIWFSDLNLFIYAILAKA